jgi:1-aminocyclopropane-1-carboxylate deaminase/D-cysteine desulfhydrase-like pyridoxal-dependent ACC family enzyme
MCRATTAAASKLGLKTVLLLRGTGEEEPQGNLLLDQVLGADIRFISTTDPYDPSIVETIEQIAEEMRAKGHCPYILHLPGRTGALATAAYVSGAEELIAQCTQLRIVPDYLFVAVGSGITMAGLVLGLKHLGRATRVVGISVQTFTQAMIPRIIDKANQASALLGLQTRISADDFILADQYIGSGYAVPTPEAIEAIHLVGQTEGILLDPVYTGKAMAGLLDYIRFLNTGKNLMHQFDRGLCSG